MSTASVDGIELYYEEHGSGDPLLLIMGLGADLQGWMFQVPELATHFRTIVFDNRGIGRSSKPAGPYTTARMADDAVGVLDATGVGRAHVVGVSMGGMIAQEMALRHPERVGALVLACTYAAADEQTRQFREASTAELGGVIGGDGTLQLDATGIDPLTVFQQLIPRVFSPHYIANELPKLMELLAGSLQWGFSIEALLGQVEATMTHDSRDRLAGIRSPTLVITGDADLLIPPHCSDVLADLIPNAKLVKLPGGSHAFNFEQPSDFNRQVLDFLASAAG